MSRAPDGLLLARRAFCWVENVLVCGLMVLLVGVAVWRIIVRQAGWQIDAMWADPLLKHTVLWLTVLGGALATKDRNHINIDVVGRLLRGRWRAACQVVTNLFAAAVCAALAYACYQFVWDQRVAFIEQRYDSSGTLFGSVPAWWAQVIMPVAFGVISLRFLLQTVEDAYGVAMGLAEDDVEAEPAVVAEEGGES